MSDRLPAPAPDSDEMTPADGKLFDRLFVEGMALVEETAAYLDGEGRAEAKALHHEASLTYAAWSMELTTRLMQAASWLVMQKAVRDGEMRRQDAFAPKYRMRREEPPLDASAQRQNGLPHRFLDLVDRSEALFERICRLDHALYVDASEPVESPVSRQLAKLQAAADAGTFDPMSIWQKAR